MGRNQPISTYTSDVLKFFLSWKSLLSILKFCASSNLLFSYEPLIGSNKLSRNVLLFPRSPIGHLFLGGLS